MSTTPIPVIRDDSTAAQVEKLNRVLFDGKHASLKDAAAVLARTPAAGALYAASAAPGEQAAVPAAEPTAKQIHAAARKMCDLSAEACGVDKDDNWAIYGDDYNAEAKIVLTAALLAREAAPVEAKPQEVTQVGELLHTQDNRYTEAPIFVVEEKTPVISDSDYNDCRVEWRESENGDYQLASPERAARLEALHRAGRDTEGWRRLEVTDVWTFVTACFTEKGCHDYLARNGHNLRETRVYAYGSFRNNEFRAVRNWLMSMAAATEQENKQ